MVGWRGSHNLHIVLLKGHRVPKVMNFATHDKIFIEERAHLPHHFALPHPILTSTLQAGESCMLLTLRYL